MDKPLSQERLSESDIRVIEADLFGVTRIIKDRVFHEMYANSRNMSIKLLSEVKRLQAIEVDYIALQEILHRARKLAFESVEGDETNESN